MQDWHVKTSDWGIFFERISIESAPEYAFNFLLLPIIGELTDNLRKVLYIERLTKKIFSLIISSASNYTGNFQSHSNSKLALSYYISESFSKTNSFSQQQLPYRYLIFLPINQQNVKYRSLM